MEDKKENTAFSCLIGGFSLTNKISISRHTISQQDADNYHLLLGVFLTKGALYLHLNLCLLAFTYCLKEPSV